MAVIIASNETSMPTILLLVYASLELSCLITGGYLNDGDIESIENVQSVAVVSWGCTVCPDSQGNKQDVGWNADGTRPI